MKTAARTETITVVEAFPPTPEPTGLFDQWFDRIFFRKLSRAHAVDHLPAKEAMAADAGRDENAQQLLRYLNNIDVKSAPLLTHVSMMIAVLGITAALLPVSAKQATKMLIHAEIGSYILICVCMLRCLHITGPHTRLVTKTSMYLAELRYEVEIRKRVYLYSLTATAVVTLAFLGTIAMHALT